MDQIQCAPSFINHFPESLLIEILNKLPLKTIFRLKCVSKRWLSLISDPLFACNYVSSQSSPKKWTLLHKHIHDEKSNVPLNFNILHNLDLDLKDFNTPTLSLLRSPCSNRIDDGKSKSPQIGQAEVLASSDGFLLCCERVDFLDHYYIFNQVTGQQIMLPPLPNPEKRKRAGEGFLTQVQDQNRYVIASYVVARVSQTCLEIFTSEIGVWWENKVCFPQVVELRGNSVSLNGFLHWICKIPEGNIIAVDPNCEVIDHSQCRLISLPLSQHNSNVVSYLFYEFGGELRYIEVCGFYQKTQGELGFKIWTLKDYDAGNWCLEHQISKSDIIFDSYFINLYAKVSTLTPIAYNPNDANIIYFMRDSDTLLSYNIGTRKLETLKCIWRAGKRKDWWIVFPFVLPPWPIVVARAEQNKIKPNDRNNFF